MKTESREIAIPDQAASAVHRAAIAVASAPVAQVAIAVVDQAASAVAQAALAVPVAPDVEAAAVAVASADDARFASTALTTFDT